MKKTRRRVGRARRNKARLIREIREWTKTNHDMQPPRRGRLRVPVLNLMTDTDATLRLMHARTTEALAPVLDLAWRHGLRT